jgi:hypothetical protein
MGIKGKIYMKEVVQNTSRKFGSSDEYVQAYVVGEDGSIVPAFLTKNAIEESIVTASKNPEDVQEKQSFVSRVFFGS